METTMRWVEAIGGPINGAVHLIEDPCRAVIQPVFTDKGCEVHRYDIVGDVMLYAGCWIDRA